MPGCVTYDKDGNIKSAHKWSAKPETEAAIRTSLPCDLSTVDVEADHPVHSDLAGWKVANGKLVRLAE